MCTSIVKVDYRLTVKTSVTPRAVRQKRTLLVWHLSAYASVLLTQIIIDWTSPIFGY